MPRLSLARSWIWGGSSIAIGLLVLYPIVTICASWLLPISEHWNHIASHMLLDLILNSAFLLTGVVLVSGILGVSLAWLVSHFDFPGRRWLRHALILPLSLPSYVTAFIYLGLFDYSGPVSSALRFLGVEKTWDLRSIGGATMILSLALYPYVYLLSRQAFESQGRTYTDAARSLGLQHGQALWRLSIPLARPWIFGGLCLVAMETLSDFGTVSILSVSTFTTAIYKSWFGFFSPATAAQLSSMLLILILALMLVNARLNGQKVYTKNHRPLELQRPKASWQKWLCTAWCSLVLLGAFGVPVCQLIYWCLDTWDQNTSSLLGISLNSFLVGLITAALVVALSLLLVFSQRFFSGMLIMVSNRVVICGYALPGAVLAIGVFMPLVQVDHLLASTIQTLSGHDPGLLLTGTLFVLVLGLSIRFLAVAQAGISTAQQRIPRHLDEAAVNFGVYGFKQLRRVHLPLIFKSVLGAGVLVFIDVIKEMPLTLMTRPFGWDTLSVRIFELVSEGEWQLAALPSLLLVLLGIVSVVMIKEGT